MELDDLIVRAIRRWSEKLLPSPVPKARVRIGTNVLSGKKLTFPIEDPEKGLSSTSTYVLGGSGVGKSKFLEGVSREIMDAGYSVICLDGKGDLYHDLLDFCVLMGLEDRVILIDPNDRDWSVGINFLELLGETQPQVLAHLVLEALKKFFHEDDEYKAWLEEWGPAALFPLIKANFTLLDLFEFLRTDDATFRHAVLSKLREAYYEKKWRGFEKDFRKFEQATILNVVRTRADYFEQDPILRAVFGQQKTTIDWLKVMNGGGIVLANLSAPTPAMAGRTASLIGAAILHQLMTIAPSRPRGHRRPCFFVVDEFQRFVTSDFADGLERMRSFGLHFMLAHQHRDQFLRTAPEIANSIDADCRNKFIFAGSRADSEHMALELFTGLIHKGAEEIKDEIFRTFFRPIKTFEEIVSQGEVDTVTAADIASLGSSVAQLPTGDVIVTDVSGEAHIGGRAHGLTRNVALAPWNDYQEDQEVGGRSFYSPEEVKERFIAWVHNQDDRKAQWKFKSRKPIPIATRTIQPAIVTDAMRRRFKEKVYGRSARLAADVQREIEERRGRFLEQQAALSAPSKPEKAEVSSKWDWEK